MIDFANSRKLDFAIIGAAKSSTSSVANYLDLSSQIHIMKPKDGQVFMGEHSAPEWCGPGDDEVVASMRGARSGYLAQIASLDSGVRVGDASVFHMTDTGAMERLKNALSPSGFVIILLRRPDERAYSAYTHMVRDELEDLSFEAALQAEDGRRRKGWQPIWSYLGLGFYSCQVEEAFRIFGKANVVILLFEDVTGDVKATLQPVLQRLNVETGLGGTLHQVNSSGRARSAQLQRFLTKRNLLKDFGKKFVSRRLWLAIRSKLEVANLEKMEIPVKERKKLLEVYRTDIDKLSALIGRDLTHWTE